VTVELREHAIAHAARVLRESGATPAAVKVGVQLASGKTKPMIADALGIKLTTVADLTRKLYQILDVHSPAELSTKIWLAESQDRAH
jgi:DNA-binding CsgD family transcriptional regulator